MNSFWALDVETANADYSSICQIGLVHHRAGVRTASWSSLIDPRTYFDPYNIKIHGIQPGDVAGAPTFPEAFTGILGRLSGAIVVHHGHFDRTAFARCYDAHDIEPIDCHWLDSTKIVRRTWPGFSQRGYGLAKLAAHFSIPLQHHDALSDASAAAQITDIAIAESGRSIEDWLSAVKTRMSGSTHAKDFRRDGASEAPFYGEKIVFTGALQVSRSIAADQAQKLGFDVQNGVTKTTTFLCVGIQDSSSLNGYEKSSKHRKAEKLVSEGHEIRILSERDFWALASAYETGEI
ncbi:MAG: exonuclease domain-containing protein [Pseudomonadota bacterium]